MYDEQIIKNDSTPFEVRVYWTIIAAFVAIGVLMTFLQGMPDKWTYINTVILTLTLASVAWNGFLTRKTQQTLIRQTNISILPIIELHLIVTGDKIPNQVGTKTAVRESYIELENVGQGTALNVRIDDFFVKDSFHFIWHDLGTPLWFVSISSLAPKQKRKIEDLQMYDKAKYLVAGETRPDLLQFLNPKTARRNYKLVIRFSDMLGKEYAQVYSIGKDGKSPSAIQDNDKVAQHTITYN